MSSRQELSTAAAKNCQPGPGRGTITRVIAPPPATDGTRDPAPRRRLDSPWIALAGAVILAALITPAAPPLDDAYIVAHSSASLDAGWDRAYGVPPLTGITSPAFLLIVWIAGRGTTALAGLRLAIAGGVAAYAMAVWTLAGTVGVRGARRGLVLVAAIAPAPIAINLVNGLETGWACALLAWTLVGVAGGRPLLAGIAAGLLPALRPDLLPIVVVCIAVASVRAGRRRWLPALAAAIALAPFVIWIRADTGSWQPATIEAKRWFFAEGCQDIGTKAWTAARHLLTWAALAAPIAGGLIGAAAKPLGRYLLGGAAMVLGVYAASLPGALAHNEFRYLAPLLGPIGVYGLATLLTSASRAAGWLAGVLIVLGSLSTPSYVRGRQDDAIELQRITAWSSTNLPPGARVLVHDAGAISFVEGITPIDLVGLKTPASIAAHRRWTWPSCGVERGRAVDAIARAARPDYFVVLNRWNDIFHFTADLERAGWRLTLVRPQDDLERSYAVYALGLEAAGARPDR